MPGPPPKLSSERRRANPPAKGEWVALEPSDRPIPRLPKRDPVWTAKSRQRWRLWWRSAMATQWLETDRLLLLRLLELEQEHDIVNEVVTKTRLVKGSTGQLRPNPLIEYLSKLESQISTLEDKLGLSPKGRINLRWLVEEEGPVAKVPPSHDQVTDLREKRQQRLAAGG